MAARKPAGVARRCTGYLLVGTILLAGAGCADLSEALPASPSPVPTLVRLPSVTPVPPSPTPSATPTATPVVPTATPEPLFGTVLNAANVRAGPGTDFEIVAVVDAGDQVQLSGQTDEWYQVMTENNVDGWIFGQILQVDPATAEAVPRVEP